MADSRISFIPCDFNTQTTVVSSLENDSDFFALGDPSFRSLLSENLITDGPTIGSSTEINVYPVGVEGSLVWEGLPINLAVLAASPIQTAVIIIPARLLKEATDLSIHEWLANQVDSLKVMSCLEKCVNTAIDVPALAPQNSSMPSWLQSKAASFALENVKSEPDAIAIKAGLFQIYDELDRSHDFSQDCQGEGKHVAGDYWHGIMHRREPDYGNSKYWFRRVGRHPIFYELGKHATQILDDCESSAASEWNRRMTSGGWDPFAFVDLSEVCSEKEDAPLELAAQQIQWREMMLLLAQTYRDAVQ